MPETTLTAAALPKAPDMNAQREAMTKLSFLHGTWAGISESRNPDGTMQTSFSRDIIRPLLGGTLLCIEGAAFAPGSSMDGAPVSETYGIIRFNESRGTFQVTGFSMGAELTGEGRMTAPDHAAWVLQSPVGHMRFNLCANGPDGWIETGELSTDDGKNWTQVFEIQFTRSR